MSTSYVIASRFGLLFAAVSDSAPKNPTTFAMSTGDKARYKYVGTKKCRICHGVWRVIDQ